MFSAVRSAYLRWWFTRRVRRFGWTGVYVGDLRTGARAYTIGFRGLPGGAEIIVFDVPQQSANELFHQLFEELKAGEFELRDGDLWPTGEPTTKPCVWRKVHPANLEGSWLGLAQSLGMDLIPEPPFEAYQLVLCDHDGRLPWEPGYPDALRRLQPALWEPIELADPAAV